MIIQEEVPKEKPQIEDFTHLHLHTIYSTLDGMCKLKPLAEKAEKLGMKAVACTDHGHVGGCLAFQQAMKECGIKPILGAELYMTRDRRIAALPIEERNAIAVFDTLENNQDDVLNFSIEKRKKDLKTAQKYREKIHNEAGEETPNYHHLISAWGKDRINAFIKANKKLVEQYEYDMRQYHLIVLAMNQTGWKNLVTIQSFASRDCTYNGRFLADFELLEKYNEGLIITTACVGSLFSKLVQRKEFEEAKQTILWFNKVFKDRFYLEIQPLTIPQQIVTNEFYFKMHKKYGIPAVATSDVHYINEEDYDIHDTYLCVAIGRLKDDNLDKEVYKRTHKKDPDCKHWKPRMRYTNDFWLRSKEEMVDAFLLQEDESTTFYKEQEDNIFQTQEYRDFWIEAMNNTAKIAGDISGDILIGSPTTLYPKVKNLPKGFTSDQWLLAEAMDGLVKYADKMKKAGTPIDYWKYANKILDEMSVISAKHYSDYFLGVQEYVNWANSINPETKLPYACTGPGRGSAAGSLVLFLIGVTHSIDPIKYNLMFSRFLTMDRNEPPDIDVDFSYRHRPLVIKHLENVYGKDHVCHIGAWTTESIYTGIKDFARVLNIPPSVSDKINKELQAICGDDPKACFSLFDSMKESEPSKYERFKKLEEENKEVFYYARACEGVIRQWTTHASGVIACPKSLVGMVPTRVDQNKKTGEKTTIALFTGVECEEINLIKYDILGLRTIDLLEDTLKAIGKNFEWLYDTVTMDDKKTFKMIDNCETDGVFQIESDMMKGLVKDIQPDNIEDLSALVALGRPGPMGAGSHRLYSEWKHDPSKREKYLPNIEDILDRTSGVICYQEQLMQISKRVSGFNDGQADSITRKITAKKRIAMFPMMKRCHIYGKKNCEGPEGWENDDSAPWYDPKKKYGEEIPGAVSKGYTPEQLNNYFNKIEKFSQYAFNQSHSACYAYICLLSAFLKAHYPAQYMASVLSNQTDDKKKEKYMKVCEDMNIGITTPDVNHSGAAFTPIDDHTIAYGLSSIKGVNDVTAIIANAPYKNLRDATERIPKKAFNKRVAEALIKSGAFDFENKNRKELLSEYISIRNESKTKSQQEPLLENTTFDKIDCMQMESETLGRAITYEPAWKGAMPGEPLSGNCTFKNIVHRTTKKGQRMAVLDIINETYAMPSLVFPKEYPRLSKLLKEYDGETYFVKGIMTKDGDKFIVNKIEAPHIEGDETPSAVIPEFDPLDF